MGLLKKLKKGIKNVFKGVKKVFGKVMKTVGKIANSKWGKALMTAASIYMGGIAIYGALQGVSTAGAGASFLTKFAAGAKGALSALASPIATGKEALGIGTQAAGSASALTGASGAGAFGQPAGFAELGAGATAPGQASMDLLATGTQAAANGASQFAAPAAAQAATSASGGLLSKAAGAAWDFAKSPGGAKLIGNVVQGYGEGQAAEEAAKQDWRKARYYDEQWRDPAQLAKLHDVTGGYTPYQPGGGMLSRAQGQTSPTVYQPGSPEAVAAMARGY